ncbi:MAG: hypothetical protein Q4C61_10795 [Lachnospiraceae bacterium]|nr:hypothetical protein [Lachnospiraceae bacterium]
MVRRIFERAGEFLVDILKLDQPGKGKSEMHQELVSLSMEGKTAVRNYYIKKCSILLAVLIGGILISVISFVVYMVDPGETETQILIRPDYGEGDRKEELSVQIEGEEEEQLLEFTVQERKYTDREKQQLLEAAAEEMESVLPGGNNSLDEVRSGLNFPVSLKDGAVKISWLTVPYGVIGEKGEIVKAEDENGILVKIQAVLTCSGRESIYETYARVFPPVLSEQEQLYRTLQKEVELADASGSHKETLELPDHVEGKHVVWSKSSENPFQAFIMLTLILAVCVYLEMDSMVHKRAEMRRNQLMLDYPDFVWKMTMLLGAGLNMKGVFSRISEEYLKQKSTEEKSRGKKILFSGKHHGRHSEKIRYVYEEVTSACYEMQSGVSEAQAYERFGKRCQLPEYIRLGSVLSQNLKKGSKGLTSLLEQEAETSMNDRKNHARKIGEQAGTKLLLPMVLMLGVVLIILMVPAFLSF